MLLLGTSIIDVHTLLIIKLMTNLHFISLGV